jgi:hypothetical protein
MLTKLDALGKWNKDQHATHQLAIFRTSSKMGLTGNKKVKNSANCDFK